MPDEPESEAVSSPADPRGREARLEAALESVSDGFYAFDPQWRFVIFNAAAERYFGVAREAVLGRVLGEVFPEIPGSDFETRLRSALERGEPASFTGTSIVRPGRVLQVRIIPMGARGAGVVVTDITERQAAEERRHLLVNELNHRVKNTLATVQAIAAQTLRDAPADMRERFLARLMALARANDVLVADDWHGAGLSAIVAQVFSPYAGDASRTRFRMRGPALRMPPNAAVGMALALHELATNAAKYGALSVPDGRVDVRWQVEDERFTLVWREVGGPPVTPPTRSGFGNRLIRRGLAAELQAEVTLDYAPDGLVCTVQGPIPHMTSRPPGLSPSP